MGNTKTKDTKRVRLREFVGQINYDYEKTGAEQRGEPVPTADAWKAEKEALFKAYYEENKDKITEFLFIFHDKDYYVETDKKVVSKEKKAGDLKPLHVHFMLRFKNPMDYKPIYDKFGISRPENLEQAGQWADAARYLIHVSDGALNDQKHIYKTDEVVSLGDSDFKANMANRKGTHRKKRQAYSVLIDNAFNQAFALLEAGKLNPAQVSDFIKKEVGDMLDPGEITRYMNANERKVETACVLRAEALYNEQVGNRGLTTVYISGFAGTGKSFLAQKSGEFFADAMGVHVRVNANTNITNDIVSTYRGQLTSVLQDMEGGAWDYKAFLGMFDEHQIAPVPSRNKDRYYTPKLVLMANADKVDLFAKSMKGIKNLSVLDQMSEIAQVYRRVKYWLHIESGVIFIKRYDDKLRVYQDLGHIAYNSEEYIHGQKDIKPLIVELFNMMGLNTEDKPFFYEKLKAENVEQQFEGQMSMLD